MEPSRACGARAGIPCLPCGDDAERGRHRYGGRAGGRDCWRALQSCARRHMLSGSMCQYGLAQGNYEMSLACDVAQYGYSDAATLL